ncbi:MAG: TetR/AcrR family transcriptional regulator [Parvibaculum sp.]|uniref:TetR/AcrR family transcriptional regulator n=1 Tax=Parvibaculum sp. TaxID=2024848 RepID=UPI0025E41B3D|nr:TetR/AcrR family transcriptional regulator [Parvibaculum sp.]MCE9650523.1 TetR/AcrR family transcriptional regulator [Parvibaculum sp.]
MAGPAKKPRRQPKQSRARFTCDAILMATAQILETQGEAALTTNAIAERAGVSVGSLYQYFPNKDAILIEIACRETARFAAHVEEVSSREADADRATRLAIRAHLGAFEGRPVTRRAAIRAMIASEGAEKIGERTDRTARHLPAPDNEMRIDAFVLTRAVTSVIRAAVLEGFSGLNEPAFEEALMRLVTGFRAASAA